MAQRLITADDEVRGEIIENLEPRTHPLWNLECHRLQGQYCQLTLLNSNTNDTIIQQIYDALKSTEQTHFTYLAYGPFRSLTEFKEFIKLKSEPIKNTVLYSILVNNTATGFIGYINIAEEHGKIEIGHVNFSSKLSRTRAATEASYLLLKCAFDLLSYRRVEWVCDILNIKSSRAALRLGFQYEGTQLKSEICKGRSRDISWYSIVDNEWMEIKSEFERWLNVGNFDNDGQQLTKLNAAKLNSRLMKHI